MENNYIEIMIQSLKKKSDVLDQIVELNKKQKYLLVDPNLPPEELEKSIDQKAQQIEVLNQLDDGFEKLFARVREELNQNRDVYKTQIEKMQALIRTITDKSSTIQAQEARNREQIENKFADVRKQVKGVRNSQKAVKQYYQNMKKITYSDSQFIDNKK